MREAWEEGGGGDGYLPRRWRPEVRKTEARVEDGGPYIVLT